MSKVFWPVMAVLSIFSLSSLTGCMSTTSIGAGADRKQFILVSQKSALKKADKMVKKSLPNGVHQYNHSEERVVRLMNTLIPYANTYVKNGEHYDWNVHVWNSKKVNAGALANGTVVITNKIAFNPNITDEELAFVIAHEMAHVVRQHHRETATWKYAMSPVLLATAVATSGATSIAAAAGHDMYRIGFSKTTEREADALGIEIYARAGYDPKHAVSLFNKLEPLMKDAHPVLSRMPAAISTHPSFNTRKKQINKNMNSYVAMKNAHQPMTSENQIAWDFKKHETKPNFKVNRIELKKNQTQPLGQTATLVDRKF